MRWGTPPPPHNIQCGGICSTPALDIHIRVDREGGKTRRFCQGHPEDEIIIL